MNSDGSVLAWHFAGDKLRDGRPLPADGEWLEHDGPVVICESGLHASQRIIDALQYAPGATICRVRCQGDIARESDKIACRRRKIVWRIDGEELLRDFSRWAAWSVIDLWDAPQVVREYLATGNEDLRAAARAATDDVSGSATRAASWAALGAASGSTSRAASLAALGAASWVATLAESGAASRAASWAAQNRQLTAMVRDVRNGCYQKWLADEPAAPA